jgi:hypothetical protein
MPRLSTSEIEKARTGTQLYLDAMTIGGIMERFEGLPLDVMNQLCDTEPRSVTAMYKANDVIRALKQMAMRLNRSAPSDADDVMNQII